MKDEPLVSTDAATGLALYVGAALLFGGYASPVSTFDGWAVAASMREQAVLVTEADGERVAIEDLRGFSGPITEGIPLPDDVVFTMGARHRAVSRWVATHRAQDGEEDGPLAVTVGFELVRADAGGVVAIQDPVVASTGRAWPR